MGTLINEQQFQRFLPKLHRSKRRERVAEETAKARANAEHGFHVFEARQRRGSWPHAEFVGR